MATQTDNYKLTKPAGSDKYNVAVFNANSDIIDAQMKANANEIAKKQKTITGAASTALDVNFTNNRVVVTNPSGKLAFSSVTDTELGRLVGVTSNIQEQLDAKLGKTETASKATADADGNNIGNTYAKKADVDTAISELEDQIASAGVDITGAASTIVSANLTADRVTISNSSGKIAVSAVTTTELGYLAGVTSKVQDQLNNKLGKTETAAKATADASGNTITSTYATKTEVSTAQTAATNAQTTANSAQTKANEAYTLAGTKQNAITVSTEVPTVNDLAEGELWAVIE